MKNKRLGYIAFALLAFFLWLKWTFPSERLARFVSAAVYDQSGGKVELDAKRIQWKGLFSARAKDISVIVQGDPDPYFTRFERLDLGVSPLSLVTLNPKLWVKLRQGKGRIALRSSIPSAERGPSGELSLDEVNLTGLAMVEGMTGMPLQGTINAEIAFDLSGEPKASTIEGEAELNDVGIPPGPLKGIPGGLELSTPLTLGRSSFKLSTQAGTVRLGAFQQKGEPSLEIGTLEADVKLSKVTGRSPLNLCLGFKPTEAFKKANVKAPIHLAGAALKKDSLGFMQVPVQGTLQAPRVAAGRACPKPLAARPPG